MSSGEHAACVAARKYMEDRKKKKPTGYRVRHKETGQYYIGSARQVTIETGQVYKSIEAIKRHVFERMFNVHNRWANKYDKYPHLRNHDPSLWEIVEFFSEQADGKVY